MAQGREIFDQDEEGKIAELEVCGKTQSSDKKLRTGNFHCFRRSLRENEQVRETFDLKNISPGGKFPDESCPALRYILVLQRLCIQSLSLICFRFKNNI